MDGAFRFLDPGPLVDGDLGLRLRAAVPGNPMTQRAPAYEFVLLAEGAAAGRIGLRIGDADGALRVCGHIGFTVAAEHRGRGYARRACRLLRPLAAAHGLHRLWITHDPANAASRAVCVRLGAELIEVAPVPPEDPLRRTGLHAVCRWRWDGGDC